MRTRLHPSRTVLLPILTLTACASSPPRTPSHQTPSHPPTESVAALLDTQPITTTDLWPMLAEAAGDQVLSEHILTRLLDQAARDRHWTITDADINHELSALITTIDQSADPQNTPRMIESIRNRRGLGPIRFEALLRRNAILRRMIRDTPGVQTQTEFLLQQAISASPTAPAAEQLERMRTRAALVAQQSAMESLAQALVDAHEVLVMDRSLGWSRRAAE